MKFFATLAIAALAVVSAADVPACDSSLLALASSKDAVDCTTATGFSAATLKVPASDSLAKVCSEPACQRLLAAVTKAVPTECSLGGVPIKSTLVDKFPVACAEVSKAAGGAAANGTATTATTTGTPSATSATSSAPAAAGSAATDGSQTEEVEVTAGSGSMAADKSSTESPAVTTAVPTPTPTKKSSASTVVAATSAVLVAATAALL